MDTMSPFWAKYAQLQKLSARHSRLDTHAWAIDAAMDRLLDLHGTLDQDPAKQEAELARVMAQASRREHRRNLLRHVNIEAVANDDFRASLAEPPEHRFAVREHLQLIFSSTDPIEHAILQAVAMGDDCNAIALAVNIRPGNVRKRLQRLRLRYAA